MSAITPCDCLPGMTIIVLCYNYCTVIITDVSQENSADATASVPIQGINHIFIYCHNNH